MRGNKKIGEERRGQGEEERRGATNLRIGGLSCAVIVCLMRS